MGEKMYLKKGKKVLSLIFLTILLILFNNSFYNNHLKSQELAINISSSTLISTYTDSSIESQDSDLDQGIQITNHLSNEYLPDMYENIIVWEDNRNEDDDFLNGLNGDIFGYNLLTKQEFPICTDPSPQHNPRIYGDKVVWEDWRNDPDGDIGAEYQNADIYLYNITTKEEQQITSDSSDQFHPDIYGNYIVWEDHRDTNPAGPNNQNIYLYNLETQEEQIIIDAWRSQIKPKIFGNYIVWEDWRYFGISNIFYYDITKEEENYITLDSYFQYNPKIHQNKIVWEDGRTGSFDIYFYDIDTNEKKQITTNTEQQNNPDIYKDLIVWVDYRNTIDQDYSNTDIFSYDLRNGQINQISKNNEGQYFPIIWEDKIVCDDDRNGNVDIYLYELFPNNNLNHRPIIKTIKANPTKVKPYETSIITVNAYDEDGDDLFFSYECSEGIIKDNNTSAIWKAPKNEGIYTITVTVSDNYLISYPESINITVEAQKDITSINNSDEEKKETIDSEKYYFIMLIVIIIFSLVIFIVLYKLKKRNIYT